ncbi:hypothetical protein EJ08DRAFT_380075 [Tothia fuscella]|uniref:Uncharacterized protein n=1 Tax=Tothia fuscella TaxID=1048955 RepID=A0A9P4NL58_9PEZI|nr:hypothetical protein EJ08DRAFT_380075 [Tothia fuscella]
MGCRNESCTGRQNLDEYLADLYPSSCPRKLYLFRLKSMSANTQRWRLNIFQPAPIILLLLAIASRTPNDRIIKLYSLRQQASLLSNTSRRIPYSRCQPNKYLPIRVMSLDSAAVAKCIAGLCQEQEPASLIQKKRYVLGKFQPWSCRWVRGI